MSELVLDRVGWESERLRVISCILHSRNAVIVAISSKIYNGHVRMYTRSAVRKNTFNMELNLLKS